MQKNDKIKELATIGNARKWKVLQDQYLFCLDLLDCSIHERGIDEAIEELETRFEGLLEIDNLLEELDAATVDAKNAERFGESSDEIRADNVVMAICETLEACRERLGIQEPGIMSRVEFEADGEILEGEINGEAVRGDSWSVWFVTCDRGDRAGESFQIQKGAVRWTL